MTEYCWICGNVADSREHIPKASDLRQTFGSITPQTPVYFNSHDVRNRKLVSAKTKQVKSARVLCRRCNDTRTQSFDHDWSVLSAELARRAKRVSGDKRIKLRKLFPGRAREAALNIHLYFTKLFGCRIVSEKIPVPIEPFRVAIETNKPCEGLTMIFGRDATHQVGRHAHVSEIQAKLKNNRIVVAGWTYVLDRFFIEIMWFESLKSFGRVAGHWTPDNKGTIIKLMARE